MHFSYIIKFLESTETRNCIKPNEIEHLYTRWSLSIIGSPFILDFPDESIDFHRSSIFRSFFYFRVLAHLGHMSTSARTRGAFLELIHSSLLLSCNRYPNVNILSIFCRPVPNTRHSSTRSFVSFLRLCVISIVFSIQCVCTHIVRPVRKSGWPIIDARNTGREFFVDRARTRTDRSWRTMNWDHNGTKFS